MAKKAKGERTQSTFYVLRFTFYVLRGRWKWVGIAAAVLLWATVAPLRAEEKLVILSPHWEGIRKEYDRAFAAWHQARYGTVPTVEWLDMGGTSDDVKFIQSQYSTGNEDIGIDLFWGGGIDPYLELAEAGYLEPYRLPQAVLAGIPAEYSGLPMYDPQFRWYGTAMAGFGIIYNKVVLKTLHLPEPQTWEDLARPELFTWVGSADPRNSGSVHMMYEIILQAYGWPQGFDLIRRMGANIRAFPKASSRTPKDTALGEVACGLAIDIYALTQIDEAGSDKLGFVMPEGKTVINPDGIALLRNAPHRELAQRFIHFVLSGEGQRLLMLPVGAEGGPQEFSLNRMSVLPALYEQLGAQCTASTNPFAWTSTLRYDADKGSARWPLVNDLIGALVIDTHEDLIRTWAAIQRAGMPKIALAKLAEMPLTEEQGLALAAQWDDQERRGQEIARWVTFAREQYAEARRLCGPAGRNRWGGVKKAVRLMVPLGAGVLLLVFLVDLVRQGAKRLGRA